MTAGVRPPADQLAPILGRWMSDHLGERATVTDVQPPAGNGYSSETLIFRAGADKFVARLVPLVEGVFPTYDIDAQRWLMQAAGERVGLPVPTVRWWEDDPDVLGSPFFVMDCIEAMVPPDNPPYTMGGWILDGTDDQRRHLHSTALDTMARLHAHDPDDGFGALGSPQRGDIDGELDWWDEYLDWATRGTELTVARAAMAWLRERRPSLTGNPSRVCWGDARISNMMFGPDWTPVAVLDWEMATRCDPQLDLAWWLFIERAFTHGLGSPRPTGFLSPAALVERWEAQTGLTGADVAWYEVMAGMRFSAVMARVTQILIAAGLMEAGDPMETDNLATQALVPLLEAS